jgi:hypothetical protein
MLRPMDVPFLFFFSPPHRFVIFIILQRVQYIRTRFVVYFGVGWIVIMVLVGGALPPLSTNTTRTVSAGGRSAS